MRLITNSAGYIAQRNYAGLSFDQVTFERVYDAFKVIRALDDRIPGSRYQVQRSLSTLFFHPSTAPKHLINSVNVGPGIWITTYSERLPLAKFHTPPWLKRLVWRRLAADSCHAIIAISEHARGTMLRDLEKARFASRSEIRSKIHVLYPPQERLVEKIEQKPSGFPKKFVFVGTDFYRKGGAEAVIAFDRLIDEGASVELHLVTEVTQRPGTRTTQEKHHRINSLINRHDQIILHGKLPNEEVLALLREAHVGLLPTYDDAFGYTVLEAQAAGCPTITTNQRALPEINSERTGWMIELPLNRERGVRTDPPYGSGEVSTQIEEGIYSAAAEAVENPAAIVKKGKAAMKRVSHRHDPSDATAKLHELYRGLGRG